LEKARVTEHPTTTKSVVNKKEIRWILWEWSFTRGRIERVVQKGDEGVEIQSITQRKTLKKKSKNTSHKKRGELQHNRGGGGTKQSSNNYVWKKWFSKRKTPQCPPTHKVGSRGTQKARKRRTRSNPHSHIQYSMEFFHRGGWVTCYSKRAMVWDGVLEKRHPGGSDRTAPGWNGPYLKQNMGGKATGTWLGKIESLKKNATGN